MSKAKKWKARYKEMAMCCEHAELDVRAEQQKFYEAQHEGSVAQARVRQLEGEAEELIRVLGEATAALDKVSAQRDEAEALAAQTEHLRDDLDRAVKEITKLNNEQEAAWERGFHEGHRAATTITSERIRTLELDLKDALHAAGQRGDTEEIPTVDVSVFAPLWHGVPDPRPQIEEERRAEEQAAVDAALRAGDPRGPHHLDCMRDWSHTGPCHVHCTTCDDRTGGCSDCSEGGGIVHAPQAKSAIEVPKPVKDEGEGMLIAYVTARELQPGDSVRFNGTGGRFLTVLETVPASYEEGTITVTIRFTNKHDSTPFGDFTYTMEGNAVVERNENP